MADDILDRKKHPDWNGQRTKMVYAFPKARSSGKSTAASAPTRPEAEPRPGRDRVLRRQPRGDGRRRAGRLARAVRARRALGVQHAMNLRLRDERAFFAEYQNEPLPEDEARGDELTPTRSREGQPPAARLVPISCNRVTAMIDVQASLLYLRRLRLGGRLHRLRDRLRHLPRPETALFHPPDAKATLARRSRAPGSRAGSTPASRR
jgi:hypothetical protein